MITRDNLREVILAIDEKDKKRILSSDKEYVAIYLHVFNVGYFVTIKLTDHLERYINISNDGNCILEINEVIEILEGEER